MDCMECDRSANCSYMLDASTCKGILYVKGRDCPLDWQDKKVDEMTPEQMREAVKALRKVVADRMSEPVKENDEPCYEKPPLGCKPAFVASAERIEELSEAITRQIKSDSADIDHIRVWAKEIVYHCDILTMK